MVQKGDEWFVMQFLCLVKLQTPTMKNVVLQSDEVNNSKFNFHLSQSKNIIACAYLAHTNSESFNIVFAISKFILL